MRNAYEAAIRTFFSTATPAQLAEWDAIASAGLQGPRQEKFRSNLKIKQGKFRSILSDGEIYAKRYQRKFKGRPDQASA